MPFDQKLNPSPGHVHYDAERAFYQIAEGTGQSPTGAHALSIATSDTAANPLP